MHDDTITPMPRPMRHGDKPPQPPAKVDTQPHYTKSMEPVEWLEAEIEWLEEHDCYPERLAGCRALRTYIDGLERKIAAAREGLDGTEEELRISEEISEDRANEAMGLHRELVTKSERIAELERDRDEWKQRAEESEEALSETCEAYAVEAEARAELEKEAAQWQESCGQNYVRATEAEMRITELERDLIAAREEEKL